MSDDSVTEQYDPVAKRAHCRVGTRLRGKWLLQSLIGVGGMACVYAAVHRNGKRGAVKVLHTELSLDTHLRGRFLREGYVANRVGHPGAVSVLDDDVTEDGAVFLVMELLEGESLDQRMRRMGGRLEAGEVLSIVDQLLDALSAAHDNGIVHRDLKSENVFVTVDGVVKVLDFGIARMREITTASAVTQSGITFGTPAYMPPEQALGHASEVDARSDIWAVGATLFTLLTGRLVHQGATVNEVLIAAGTKHAPLIRTLMPELSPRVADLVDRALAFEKASRWPDARAMQAALRKAYYAMSGAPITTAPKLEAPALARTEPSPGVVAAASPGPVVKTNEPVSSGKSGVSLRSLSRRSPLAVAAIGVAGAVLLAVLALVVVRAVTSRGTVASGSAAVAMPTLAPAAADAALVGPAAAPPASAAPPVITIEDLPAASSDSKAKSRQAQPVPVVSHLPPSTSAPPTAPQPVEGDWQDRRR